MTAFAVQQKSKEIAIRKVLGATVSNLLMFVSKRFLRLAIIAAVIVVPVSWYLMNEWLSGFAYRIQINPSMFVMAIAVSLFITLMAVGIKALRAAVSNPVTKLRNE
jgi:putative ABC transport system permease protein